MTLASWTRLRPYEILAPLGADVPEHLEVIEELRRSADRNARSLEPGHAPEWQDD
ncbi:MAG TPA: hypothetical protein VNJ04_04545 [Gemmatimonadaceae bacterium]|nr:hypothetical protein [Gemmatimonadaceae bacterium]